MRLRTTSALALLAVPALALSACGGDAKQTTTTTSTVATSSPTPSSSAASPSASEPAASSSAAASPAADESPLTPAAAGDLPGVTVAGTPDKPTVTLAKPPVTVKETTAKVLTPGTGAVVKASDIVSAKVMLVSGKDGKVLEDTYGKGTTSLLLKQTMRGLARGVVGQKVGSRVLVGIAPAEGAALVAPRNPGSGVGTEDTLLALVDVAGVGFPGEPCKVVTSPDGLPQVTAEDGKAATMKPVTTPAPAQATAYVLKQGTGPVVEAGQTLSSQYTGMLWTDGSSFDSSFANGGQPVDFPIGVGQVIPAWDKCLTGQKVGSRVLVVAPPKEAYGDQAKDKIPANSTLVFVVDLVAAK